MHSMFDARRWVVRARGPARRRWGDTPAIIQNYSGFVKRGV
jgi:hypothetical protein